MTTSAQYAPYDDREPLTITRIRLAAHAGETLDLLGSPAPHVMFEADVMEAWGAERTIEAPELRRLLVEPDRRMHARGVHLRGARIAGQLDLKAAKLLCPLQLEDCYFDDACLVNDDVCLVNVDHAEVSLLALIRCRLAGLSGDSLKATKGLDLTGSILTQALTLPNADITGRLCCTGAELRGAVGDPRSPAVGKGYALDADSMKVRGDVCLDGSFTAVGGVWLNRADIDGQLDCTGATLTAAWRGKADDYPSCGDCAMYADGLKVGDNVILSRCTANDGGIRLSTATISGELICKGTQLHGRDHRGNALRANQLKTSGNVSIGAYKPRGIAGADKPQGFVADGGKISLTNATIGGELRLQPQRLGVDENVALDARNAHITQGFRWEPREPGQGRVILENVSVGRLEDTWTPEDRGHWPFDGSLRLDGFTYGSIASTAGGQNDGAGQRLEWIRSQYGRKESKLWSPQDNTSYFATQPYQQLASSYQQAGLDADARRIAIARRRDFRRYGRISRPGKIGNLLLDISIRYGYRTWRAAAGLAALYLLVVLFFFFASHNNAVIPVQTTPGLQTPVPGVSVQDAQTVPSATKCTTQYPCFNPWGYAVDVVIPIINVHQADFWGPNRHAVSPWGWSSVWVSYLSTGLGWLLATLAVAGYTGLARNASAP